jgi:hypothetical protein
VSDLTEARRVADAVMFEGYLLYPYRASADKNRIRWQFGVVVPGPLAEAGWPEPASVAMSCLLDPGTEAWLGLTARFLEIRPGATDSAVDAGEPHEFTVRYPVADLLAGEVGAGFDFAGGTGRLRVSAVPCTDPGAPYEAIRITARLENSTDFADMSASRDEVLRHSLVSAHLMLAAEDARFLSLLEPPEWAAPFAASCTQEGLYPVLVGEDERLVLASPIILYDHPQIAPESGVEFFDATEIDEILTLRTLTLTDAEKAEVRAGDPKAAALLDRVEAMPAGDLQALHGTIRRLRPLEESLDDDGKPWWDPGSDTDVDPLHDTVLIGGTPVAAGARVQLRPGVRRADAQDMFLDGRNALVHAVLSDLNGDSYLAVTIEDDPGAQLQAEQGRFYYFAPDECRPLP